MANKITWTNVAQPDFSNGNALLANATNTLQDAIKSGQATLDDIDTAVQKGIKSNLAYYLENLPKESFNEANRANTLVDIHNHMVELDNSLGGGLTAEAWNVGNEFLAKQQLTNMANREYDQNTYKYNANTALADYLGNPENKDNILTRLNPTEHSLFNDMVVAKAESDAVAQDKILAREALQTENQVNDVLGSLQYTSSNINSLKMMLANPQLSESDRANIQGQINTLTTGFSDSLSKLPPSVRSRVLGEISKNQGSFDKDFVNTLLKYSELDLKRTELGHNISMDGIKANQEQQRINNQENQFNKNHGLNVFEALNNGSGSGGNNGRGKGNNNKNPYEPSDKAKDWGFTSIRATTGQVDENGKPKITLDNNAIINTFTNKITATRDNYFKEVYGTTSYNDWVFKNKDILDSKAMQDSPLLTVGTYAKILQNSWGALQQGLKAKGITMTDLDKIRVSKALSVNPSQLNVDEYLDLSGIGGYYKPEAIANLAINLRLQEEGAIKQRVAQEINTGLDILTREYNGKSSAAELAYLTGLNVNPLFKQYADTTLQRTVNQIATNYHQRDQARQSANSNNKKPTQVGNVDISKPLAKYVQPVGTNTVIRPAGQFSVLKPK